eukprot:GHVU01201751.1.p1 GENE.GHVU01201751.1~~GHVU01201751.1.p1  ORF type:complete len:122 (+),score=9.59 GHVU01201751.1:417-782(+)
MHIRHFRVILFPRWWMHVGCFTRRGYLSSAMHTAHTRIPLCVYIHVHERESSSRPPRTCMHACTGRPGGGLSLMHMYVHAQWYACVRCVHGRREVSSSCETANMHPPPREQNDSKMTDMHS